MFYGVEKTAQIHYFGKINLCGIFVYFIDFVADIKTKEKDIYL